MSRVFPSIALSILLLTLPISARAAEMYEVDATHSNIGFKVKHMGVSSVRGEFKEYTAELMVDEDNVQNSSIVLRIDAASVDTDNQRRDEHIRSADFFAVETYPKIVFESKKIVELGDGYKVTGDLTIKEVTKEISFDLEINGPIKDPWGNHRVGTEGELVIDRQDYGVKFSNIMDNGGLVVANDVKISFALEASRKLEE